MVISIAFALLWVTPVHADWQYTKWGMTPEQVIEASGGTVSKVPAAQQQGSSRPGLAGLLAGAYSSGDFNFKVDFQFSKNKLEEIGMTLLEYNRCEKLQSALLSKYGSPRENRSSLDSLRSQTLTHLIWHDTENSNTVWFTTIPSISLCSVLYMRLDVAGAKGL